MGFLTRQNTYQCQTGVPPHPPKKEGWPKGGETNSEFAGFYIDPKNGLNARTFLDFYW